VPMSRFVTAELAASNVVSDKVVAADPEPEVKPEDKPAEDEAPKVEGEAAPERSATTGIATGAVNAEEIRALEITRQEEIRKAVRTAKLDEAFADGLVKGKNTLDEARALIFKEMEKRTENKTSNQRVEVGNMDTVNARSEAAVRGLLHRYNPDKYKLQPGDGNFRQDSMVDLARNFLAAEGVRGVFDMTRSEIAKRALHSTSDFPNVLANTANKALRDAYQGAPNTYAPFVSPKSVKDFKEVSSVQLGNGGKLEQVNEHGEYQRTTLAESAEKYKVEKYGLVLGKTYELMVNDDLGAFTRVPAQLGVRAREKENEIFWGLIIANQVMLEDGLAMFHATHGNLTASGTAISVASLGVARKSLRLMKDLEGELLNLTPKYLVVPPSIETVADQFVSQVTPSQGSEVNPFANRLQVISEPRLEAASAIAWYAMAGKEQVPMAEMALIDGQGPEMFVREGFDIDGMELKIRHIFGMRVVDYRGFYKNAGA